MNTPDNGKAPEQNTQQGMQQATQNGSEAAPRETGRTFTPEAGANAAPGGGQTANSHPSDLVLKIARELERERLTGVGGWLILFIVLYAFSLLALGFDLFMGAVEPDPYSMYMYGPQPSPLWRASDFIKLGLIVAVYVCMAKHKKITPLLCKLLVILEFMVGNLYLMLDPDMLMDELFESVSHEMLAGVYFVFSLLYAVAWYAYFSRSKRVGYTFVN